MIDVVLLGPYYYIIYPWYVRYVVWVIFVLGFLFWIILSYTLYMTLASRFCKQV